LGDDPLQIRRISIYANDNLNCFARKLAFADNAVAWPALLQYARRQLMARLRMPSTP
jgi:hypothetical protein